jgi:hypothetical protein
LGIDVERSRVASEEDLYDATPRLKPEERGKLTVSPPSEVSKTSTGESYHHDRLASRNASHRSSGPNRSNGTTKSLAELEDTADARQRTIRINSQEEKIYYDPEDDPDRAPQMSATSYPGQEWNPYGLPEYAQWTDE